MAVVRVDNKFQILSPNTKLIAVRVTDIILGPNHPQFKKYGEYDSIGTIFYTLLKSSNSKSQNGLFLICNSGKSSGSRVNCSFNPSI